MECSTWNRSPLEVMLTLPLADAARVGAKGTVNDVLWPAVKVKGKDRPLILNPVPLAVAAEIVRLDPPELVSVSLNDFELPTLTFPNASVVGLAVSVPCVTPVPDSGMFNVGLRGIRSDADASAGRAACRRRKQNRERSALACGQGQRQRQSTQTESRARGSRGGNREARPARVRQRPAQRLRSANLDVSKTETRRIRTELPWRQSGSGNCFDGGAIRGITKERK